MSDSVLCAALSLTHMHEWNGIGEKRVFDSNNNWSGRCNALILYFKDDRGNLYGLNSFIL